MYEDQLAKVPLFSNLTEKEIRVLAQTCRPREFAPGTTLLKQGDRAAGLFIVLTGKVRVTATSADGDERELAVRGPGEMLGEMSLLDDQPRSATVTALEQTTALSMPVWEFRATLRQEPDIALKLLALISQRLRQSELRLS